jgi:hypothetical protein
MIEDYGQLQADIQSAKSNKFWRAAPSLTRNGETTIEDYGLLRVYSSYNAKM